MADVKRRRSKNEMPRVISEVELTDEQMAELRSLQEGADEPFYEKLARLAGVAPKQARKLVVAWQEQKLLTVED